jgi:hypothetical protein
VEGFNEDLRVVVVAVKAALRTEVAARDTENTILKSFMEFRASIRLGTENSFCLTENNVYFELGGFAKCDWGIESQAVGPKSFSHLTSTGRNRLSAAYRGASKNSRSVFSGLRNSCQ